MALSIPILERGATRAEHIAGGTDNVSIKISAEPLMEELEKFRALDKKIKELGTSSSVEQRQSKAAVAALAAKYDEMRSVVWAKLGIAFGVASSSYDTDDDMMEGAEDIEDQLVSVGRVEETPLNDGDEGVEPGSVWARVLLRGFSPVIDSAQKEVAETRVVRDDLQKVRNQRNECRGRLEFQFRAFRRVVRQVFGAHSREFQSLRAGALSGDGGATPS